MAADGPAGGSARGAGAANAGHPSRHGVVIGGGLLGLEAANTLRLLGLTAHVVEIAPYLMPVQVDEGGRVYGLAAPGYAMAETVADRLLGGDATFGDLDTSTKLKLLGVDVISFGDAHGTTPGALPVVRAPAEREAEPVGSSPGRAR